MSIYFLRWGGVVIINPPVDACISTKPVEITPNDATVIGVFFAQLRLLLGIPDPVRFLFLKIIFLFAEINE